MELSRKDAFMVMRIAYKTGLMKKMMAKEEAPEVHVPGTSVLDQTSDGIDFVLFEEYGKFLAELIDTVRKEGRADERS